MEGKECFLAIISTRDSSGYMENVCFCTMHVLVAVEWANRFNRIIAENKKRILSYEWSYDTREPFWYDLIRYDSPKGLVRIVGMR